MTCFECGKTFVVNPDEDGGELLDVCYECERALVAEYAPELLGDEED